jgi:hypothetical protein
MTLICLTLGALGAWAGTVKNIRTALGLPRLTEKMRSLLQRRESAEVVYSVCLHRGCLRKAVLIKIIVPSS